MSSFGGDSGAALMWSDIKEIAGLGSLTPCSQTTSSFVKHTTEFGKAMAMILKQKAKISIEKWFLVYDKVYEIIAQFLPLTLKAAVDEILMAQYAPLLKRRRISRKSSSPGS